MLGFKSEHKTIKGSIAQGILSKMVRIQTGQLNDADKMELESIRQGKNKNIVVRWK